MPESMPGLHALVILQFGAAAFMTGLIWFVQLVHYPLMAQIGEQQWIDYERQHQRRTTWIVAPFMALESCSAAGALMWMSPEIPMAVHALLWTSAALLAGLWALTFFVQVPLHRKLETAFNVHTIERLVRTNWLRTAFWTARAGLLAAVLAMIEQV